MGIVETLDTIHSDTRPAFKRCSSLLQEKTGGKHRVFMRNCDFYFIPIKYVSDVIALLEPFAKAQVYLEVAVPTVMRCLVPETSITKLPMYWEDLKHHKDGLPKDFTKYTIIHKAKWASLMPQKNQVHRKEAAGRDVKKEYCDIALPLVHGLIPTFMSP